MGENSGIHKSALSWYARDLPGRWRVVAPSTSGERWASHDLFGEEDLAFAAEVHGSVKSSPFPSSIPDDSEAHFVCGDCRHVIVSTSDGYIHSPWNDGYEWSDLTPYSDLVEAVGDHRHEGDSFKNGKIRYYTIFAVGPWKIEQWASSWTEIFTKALPYQLYEGRPAIPKSVLDSLLREGVQDRGMSGGTEYPQHVLTDDEYSVIRESLIREYGNLDVKCPPLPDYLAFLFWTNGFSDGRAYEADQCSASD